MVEAGIGGVYEVGIGVPDLVDALRYWQQFGYRIDVAGELDAAAARTLYGVGSALRSVRLAHGAADHGLVRLLHWERPVGRGLALAPLRALGSRWAATLTADVLGVMNHVEAARAVGLPLHVVEPQWAVIYGAGGSFRPFADRAVGVREMLLLQPLWRQVLFQRYGYDVPGYGQVDERAPLRTSQITHVGLVTTAPAGDFYEALGLLRVADEVPHDYERDVASRRILDLVPGERFWVSDLDDPRSSRDPRAARSGRLKIIRFPAEADLPDWRPHARPGALGMSLYTYRVRDVARHAARAAEAGARVRATAHNEFGEPSCCFDAPDGYAWAFVA